MTYQCASCSAALRLPHEAGVIACEQCGAKYDAAPDFLSYDFDTLLYKRFKKQYLLNKALNNNGLISYQMLPEGSVSLADRPDVKEFRNYIAANVKGGTVLDIGCGVLPVPGYLAFPNKGDYQLVGIDPINDKSFAGTRIVGCSEFTPFGDSTFDALVFATSLDHVCSLRQTMKESYRILKRGGKVVIWMSDRHVSVQNRFWEWVAKIKIWLRLAGILNPDYLFNTRDTYKVGRYYVYPNRTVLYVPAGAVDPFHSFYETPGKIIRSMERAGFRALDVAYHNPNQVFLCFGK